MRSIATAWIAVLLTFLHLGPASELAQPLLVRVALNGVAGAGWCWIAFVVLAWMGAEKL